MRQLLSSSSKLRRSLTALALVLAGLAIVVTAAWALSGLNDANRQARRSDDDALAAVGAAQAVSAQLAHMRAERARYRQSVDASERASLEARLDERHRTLLADLGTIAARALSMRARQAAVTAREAATAWHEAGNRIVPDGPGGVAELDRLAAIAEIQFLRLGNLTERDILATRGDAEAAADRRLRLIAGAGGAALLLVVFVAGLCLRARSRALAALDAGVEAVAAGQEPAVPSPSLARLSATLQHARQRAEAVPETGSAQPEDVSTLLAALPVGVLTLDAQGLVTFANPTAAVLLGHAPEAVLAGLPAADLHPALGLQGAAQDLEVAGGEGHLLRLRRGPDAEGGAAVILEDVGAQSRRQAEALATAARLGTALDLMSQGLCLYDAEGRLVVANRRCEEIYNLAPGSLRCGLSGVEVLQLSIEAGNHPGRNLEELGAEAAGLLSSGASGRILQELACGRVVAIRLRPIPTGGFVATYEDVTERWHAEARIAHMARHDGLTDLPNRLLFAERIDGAITQASRKRGFAVHCLDLDNFKQINDTLGHAVGDELLRAAANRLTACLREVDTVARLGGDEFAIIQTDVEGPEQAAVLARRVVEVIGAPYELSEHTVTVGVSIGIVLAPADGLDRDRLLKNADVALYKAKADGRGVYRFFEPEMDARLQARRLLEIDLRAALETEAFDLHYQPIHDLRTDRITGFEALLRWTHPTRGPVSPSEFVPLAEEVGLIVPLGEWVLRRACAEASAWPSALKIAVNVSPVQFRSAGVVRMVREALRETGLAPHRLELEITETVLLANPGATVAILHALRALGARIAMDDFGTGYSSLSYLRSFPFDKMKIDQVFIRDLVAENGSGFIVQAVISLGTKLGMTMTAEGVETEEQRAWLRDEGCDEIQGYLISHPVPAAQVPALIARDEARTAVRAA